MRKLKRATRIGFDLIWFFDHLLSPTRVDRILPRLREILRRSAIAQLKMGGPGRKMPILREKGISQAEFRKNYLNAGIPVILEGAAKEWECVKKWSPSWLSENFGNDPVALIDASPKSIQDTKYELEFTTLKEVIASMRDGPLSKYSRFNTLLKDHPDLFSDLDLAWLKRRRNWIATGKTFQVFIGGAGTRTHIHSDSEHNLFTQVYGKKHWILYPPGYDGLLEPEITRTPYFYTVFDPDKPDYERFPAMQFADSLEGEIGPGDILFVPPSYWHHVKNLSDSIGFGFRWFSFIDSFRMDFMMTLLMMLSVDPPIWIATKHREDFTKIFAYRNKK